MSKEPELGRKVAKSRAMLRSEAVVRQLANPLTFACTACPVVFTRARNLKVHMCTIHKLFSDSLIARESFPKRNSLVRAATVEELAEHSKVRVRVRGTGSVGPVPNRVISDDDEEGSGSLVSGVAETSEDGSRNIWASFTPIVLPLTALCPAAAGSAAQLAVNQSYDHGPTLTTNQ